MKNLLMQAKWIITLFLFAMLGAFALQNTADVELDFLIWNFKSRRIVVIVASLAVGLAIGWIFGLSARRKN